MRKNPLEFIIAYERSKDKKRLLKSIISLICKCVNTLLAHSRHAIHKTDHKQNYYRSFLYKYKLGLHLIWKKTLSEDFQEEVHTTFRKSIRLSGSPYDFQEVLTTEVEVVWKTSWKSSSALYFRRLTFKEIIVGLESFSLGKK
ncbi:hypothetical protein IGI04_019530 [Brassica rapa subsp. trilocularis]|uniref:Uncharacterized protein n=1 Tax=Brassica rapa subsp. trilocularis TaxID=1813537 RepID=A0ABQ7MJI8_BRACM|nr:hypothetical protein IGI04_019530 [Brassica rapa subsp. trilocularis]